MLKGQERHPVVTCLLHLFMYDFSECHFVDYDLNPLYLGSHMTPGIEQLVGKYFNLKSSFQPAVADCFVCVFQVSVNGLEVLCLMVDRMGEEFKPHITTGSYPPLIPPDLLVCL